MGRGGEGGGAESGRLIRFLLTALPRKLHGSVQRATCLAVVLSLSLSGGGSDGSGIGRTSGALAVR